MMLIMPVYADSKGLSVRKYSGSGCLGSSEPSALMGIRSSSSLNTSFMTPVHSGLWICRNDSKIVVRNSSSLDWRASTSARISKSAPSVNKNFVMFREVMVKEQSITEEPVASPTDVFQAVIKLPPLHHVLDKMREICVDSSE